MLRFSFVPMFAFWLGLFSGLCTILMQNPAPKDPSSTPIAQEKSCSQVTPSTIVRTTRKDKMEGAVEENIRRWSIEIKNSSGRKHALAHYFRAENYYVIGKYDEAMRDLEAVPNLAKPVRASFIARINNGLGQYEAALTELGHNNYGSEIRAYALLKTNQVKGAIEECNKSIKQHNANELTYLIRGQAYQSLGENQKAIRDFTKSLYKATIGDESFVDYQSSQNYDTGTEVRLLHNAEVYQRRAMSFARTGKSTRAMQDMKQSALLGFSAGMDAGVFEAGMGAVPQ